jgi:hypothetical protein
MTKAWTVQGQRRGQGIALRLLWVSLIVLAALAHTRGVAADSTAPRATELQGLLPDRHGMHFFGLESIQPQGAVVLTLTYAAAGLGAGEEVTFAVLDEVGLVRLLAGSDPLDVARTVGSPPLVDPAGHRRTALATGVQQAGDTVIVFSRAHGPVSYRLAVQGGLLRDDARQSQALVLVDAPGQIAPAAAPPPVTLVRRPAAADTPDLMPWLSSLNPAEPPAILAPVPARRVTGELARPQERHYLRLAPDGETGEVTLTLEASVQDGASGQLNFWVLTQDGVRHLTQGALIQELNLASGAPVLSPAGTAMRRAQLAVAGRVAYVVVVTNEQAQPASYSLTVSGGLLYDDFGQTYEAQAAAAEALALAGQPSR